MNDNLTLREIEEALIHGRVLESYPDTGRGPSCMVVGFTSEGTPIHIVCGERRDDVVIVTVYIPGPPKFSDPYRRSSR